MSRNALATISASRLERFLMALANLRNDDEAALNSFVIKFQDMLAGLPTPEQWWSRNEQATINALQATRDRASGGTPSKTQSLRHRTDEYSIPLFASHDEMQEGFRILCVVNYVRDIWNAPTRHEKELRTLALQAMVASAGEPTFLLGQFIQGPFSTAILHLLKSAGRALVCTNPECPARYFFRNARRQQYCSPECSGFGQREAKKKWWSQHGKQWRKRHGEHSGVRKNEKGEKNVARKTR